jgi:hypothetical protein
LLEDFDGALFKGVDSTYSWANISRRSRIWWYSQSY